MSSSLVVTGPLAVTCESVTVGGSNYTGEILVQSGTAHRLMRHTKEETALFAPSLVIVIIIAFMTTRFHL